MNYSMKVYESKALGCFNSQRFEHTAKNYKEQRICARCGGDHNFGKSGKGVQPKCCNYGRAYNVAYGGSEVMRQENKIQKVRVERRITYAEAVRVSRKQNNATNEQGAMGVQELQQMT